MNMVLSPRMWTANPFLGLGHLHFGACPHYFTPRRGGSGGRYLFPKILFLTMVG